MEQPGDGTGRPEPDGPGQPEPNVTVRVRGGRFEVYAATGTPAGELAATITRVVAADAGLSEAFGGDDYGEMLIVFRSAAAAPETVRPD